MRTLTPFLLIIMGCMLLLANGFAGRFAVDGISYFTTNDLIDYQNAKLLRMGHYQQTTEYTCGPATIMNLLYYYKKLSAIDLNRQTEMRIAREMGTSINGTSQSDVVSWLNNNGFNVSSGNKITSQEIISNLNSGIPTMLIFDGHWLISSGYSAEDSRGENDIIFSDSVAGVTVIPGKYIDTMWAQFQLSEYHKLGNPGYYVVAVPR